MRRAEVGSGTNALVASVCGNAILRIVGNTFNVFANGSLNVYKVVDAIRGITNHFTSLKSFAFTTPVAVPVYASLEVPARPRNLPSSHSLSSLAAPDFFRGSLQRRC